MRTVSNDGRSVYDSAKGVGRSDSILQGTTDLLKKAAKIAAKKHVLLADPTLPPAWVNAKTKPMSQELT